MDGKKLNRIRMNVTIIFLMGTFGEEGKKAASDEYAVKRQEPENSSNFSGNSYPPN